MTRRHNLYRLANRAAPTDQAIPAIPTAASKYASVRAKVRDNKPHRKELAMAGPTTELVPIGLLVGDGFDLPTVIRRHADQLTRNVIGLSCLPGEVVRQMIAERDRHEEAERQRQAAELEAAKHRPNPLRERVRRLAQRQRPADDSLDAFGAMLAFDPDNALAVSGRAMDEMLSNSPVYHKIERD
jgi:hypothetical protein